MKKVLFFLTVSIFAISCGLANATNITLYKSEFNNNDIPINKVNQLINKTVNIDLYRQVKVQVILNKAGKPDHILVFLFARQYHSFKVSRININSNYGFVSFIQNYQLTKEDIKQRPGMPSLVACPDASIQFVSIAPNKVTPYRNDQQYAIEADAAAKAKGLHTVLLLGKDATSANWLDYMSCPKLEGNFYDGDATPSRVITTDNGYLTNKDFSTTLKGKFRLKVTNIWLACQAYNDPMKSAVINDAQAQKYAAGISNLLCGPSDKTAVCTMEKALNGSKISASFSKCYKADDQPQDKWGLGGNGSDYFGQ